MTCAEINRDARPSGVSVAKCVEQLIGYSQGGKDMDRVKTLTTIQQNVANE